MAENETNNNIDIVSSEDVCSSPVEKIVETDNVLYEPTLIDEFDSIQEPVASKEFNNTIILDTIYTVDIQSQPIESQVCEPIFSDLQGDSCPTSEDGNICEQGYVVAEFTSQISAVEVTEQDIRHNNIQNIQGGTSTERYHVTKKEWQAIHNANAPSDTNVFVTVGDLPTLITGDKYYKHSQGVVSDVWLITHGLNKYPSVTTTDSAKNVVEGSVRYIDNNTVEISFSAPFSGYAEFN